MRWWGSSQDQHVRCCTMLLYVLHIYYIHIWYIYVCMQLYVYIDVDAYRSLYLDMLNIFWLCRHATYTLQCASRRCVHAGAHAVQWRSGTGVPHVHCSATVSRDSWGILRVFLCICAAFLHRGWWEFLKKTNNKSLALHIPTQAKVPLSYIIFI